VLDSVRISFIVQDYGERLDLTLSTDGELAGKLQDYWATTTAIR